MHSARGAEGLRVPFTGLAYTISHTSRGLCVLDADLRRQAAGDGPEVRPAQSRVGAKIDRGD